MPSKEFKSALDSTEPVEFTIGDEKFQAVPVLPAKVLLEMASLAGEAGDEKTLGMEMMHKTVDFLDAVLLPDSRERFAEGLSSPTSPIDVPTLLEVFRWLMGVYTGRPTEQASPSSDGASTTSPNSTESSPATESTS